MGRRAVVDATAKESLPPGVFRSRRDSGRVGCALQDCSPVASPAGQRRHGPPAEPPGVGACAAAGLLVQLHCRAFGRNEVCMRTAAPFFPQVANWVVGLGGLGGAGWGLVNVEAGCV